MGNNYTSKRKVIDEVSASFYISMSGFIGHFFVILVEEWRKSSDEAWEGAGAVIDYNFGDSSIVTETQQAMELKTSNVETESMSWTFCTLLTSKLLV